MSISFLFDGNIARFKEFANEFFEKNAELKHSEMEMEMLILAAFIYNFEGDEEMSYHYYIKGYEQAKIMNKEFYKATCLSNLGIINSNKEMDELFNALDIENSDEEDNEEEMDNEIGNMNNNNDVDIEYYN